MAFVPPLRGSLSICGDRLSACALGYYFPRLRRWGDAKIIWVRCAEQGEARISKCPFLILRKTPGPSRWRFLRLQENPRAGRGELQAQDAPWSSPPCGLDDWAGTKSTRVP